METYHDMLRHVLLRGVYKTNRTGIGAYSTFGYMVRFDLAEGFPAVTTKKLFFKGVVEELLWFVSGQTNVRPLQDKGVRIWDEWADEAGELGPVYGAQWRAWNGQIDQLGRVVQEIRTNPGSRRLLVSAWNVAELPRMALPPCHYAFQFNVTSGKLSCLVNQRSADVFLGVPFNIASYALLTHLVAQVTGLEVGELVMSFGDLHLYENHLEQAETQLKRKSYPPPTLWLDPTITELDRFRSEHIRLDNYQSHPALKGEVAV